MQSDMTTKRKNVIRRRLLVFAVPILTLLVLLLFAMTDCSEQTPTPPPTPSTTHTPEPTRVADGLNCRVVYRIDGGLPEAKFFDHDIEYVFVTVHVSRGQTAQFTAAVLDDTFEYVDDRVWYEGEGDTDTDPYRISLAFTQTSYVRLRNPYFQSTYSFEPYLLLWRDGDGDWVGDQMRPGEFLDLEFKGEGTRLIWAQLTEDDNWIPAPDWVWGLSYTNRSQIVEIDTSTECFSMTLSGSITVHIQAPGEAERMYTVYYTWDGVKTSFPFLEVGNDGRLIELREKKITITPSVKPGTFTAYCVNEDMMNVNQSLWYGGNNSTAIDSDSRPNHIKLEIFEETEITFINPKGLD